MFSTIIGVFVYNYSYYPINCSFLFNGFCYAHELEGAGWMGGLIKSRRDNGYFVSVGRFVTVVTYPGAWVELQTSPPLSESPKANMQSIAIIYTVYIPLHVVGSESDLFFQHSGSSHSLLTIVTRCSPPLQMSVIQSYIMIG